MASFGQPVPLIGYSQGGRIALLAALEHPGLVDRLVLISASPGIRGPAAQASRRERDERLADHIVKVGIESFLDEWLDGPTAGTVHADDATRRRDREMRSVNTTDGLAAALRGIGQGAQPYVGDRIADLGLPLLTVSGARDGTYTKLAGEMADAALRGAHVTISGAGHNVILDAPDALARVVSDFCLE